MTYLYTAYLIFSLLGAVLIIWLKHSGKAGAKAWLKYGVYVCLGWFQITIISYNTFGYAFFLGLVGIMCFVEIARLPVKYWILNICFFIYFITMLIGGVGLSLFSSKEVLLFVFLIPVVFDAFSQLGGQLIKSIKIAPKISPNKTLAGLLSGILMVQVFTWGMEEVAHIEMSFLWLKVIAVSLVCLFGDLLASYVKRVNGIKDFSNILPGHGGFLDRFDGLVPCMAAAYIILEWS